MTHGFPRIRTRYALALASALISLGVTAGNASAATTTFTTSTAIAIPDSGDANPYPSSIKVDGLTGSIQKATVTLRRFSHTCPNDVDVLLVGPTGADTILFGDVGSGMGCPVSENADLTFDQDASSNVPYPPVTGTYRPTAGTVSPFNPPAPAGPYPLDLNVFKGTQPNGTWNLFVHDTAGGDSGSFAGGWSVALTGPSPSNSFSVGTPTRNKKKGTATIPVTVTNPGTVTLTGTGVATQSSSRASKAVSVGANGTVSLLVKATGKKKKKLNTKGKVKVSPTITYTPTAGNPPTAGAPTSTSTVLKLKKKLKKRK